MWPFRKKQVLPPPEDFISGDDRAVYSTTFDQWEFEIEGIEFTLAGREFDRRTFGWAREAITMIKRLEAEIDRHVLEELDGWPCDIATRHLLSVSMDDYTSEGHLDLAYVGDDSWGDFGVNVIVADGKVIESYGGD
ncbi:hypothetical protein [Luteolibacter pohnpeiensis]|nr:hypothetical protein [Luteolibacter pohnpeiensis]